MSSPVALILGSGSRVGQASALAFKAAGYQVAIASRSLQHLSSNSSGFLELRVDLTDPEAVPPTFDAVEKAFGAPPSVVIYNASSGTFLPDTDPLSDITLADVLRDNAVNQVSALIAAKHAVAGFERLPATASKTYIFTGNLLNVNPRPAMLIPGAGKTATANVIQALTRAYGDKGYKFYYADQRNPDGSTPLNKIDGDAHAVEYLALASDKAQRPWQYTFAKDVGYKHFTPEQSKF